MAAHAREADRKTKISSRIETDLDAFAAFAMFAIILLRCTLRASRPDTLVVRKGRLS